MTTNKTNPTKKETKKAKFSFKTFFSGIGMLFVIASIIAMAVIIWLGTDGIISRVLTVPSVLFAAYQAVIRFTK